MQDLEEKSGEKIIPGSDAFILKDRFFVLSFYIGGEGRRKGKRRGW